MKAILFDLDNTLYPPERQLFNLIDRRINDYMQQVVGIAAGDVDGLRRRYWQDYGVTLQGLIRHHGVDPEDYLYYVHDVDVTSRLVPDPELRLALAALPYRRFIFTNGSHCHVQRVLSALALEGLFEEVFDIRVAAYLPKPRKEPYLRILHRLGLEATDCAMVEDTVINLQPAKELGMRTILVGPPPAPDYVDARVDSVHQVAQGLVG